MLDRARASRRQRHGEVMTSSSSAPAQPAASRQRARARRRARAADRPRHVSTPQAVRRHAQPRHARHAVRAWSRRQSSSSAGCRVDGMRVTGEGGVEVDGRYPAGLHGRAIGRADLDWSLLDQAIRAGAAFEPGVPARRARSSPTTAASRASWRPRRADDDTEIRARVSRSPPTAAVRRSPFGLGLVRHPAAPRRWAIGAYFEGVAGMTALGEMHIRRGRYIGVAPLPGGLTNVCLVTPSAQGDRGAARSGRQHLAGDAGRRSGASRPVRRARGWCPPPSSSGRWRSTPSAARSTACCSPATRPASSIR